MFEGSTEERALLDRGPEPAPLYTSLRTEVKIRRVRASASGPAAAAQQSAEESHHRPPERPQAEADPLDRRRGPDGRRWLDRCCRRCWGLGEGFTRRSHCGGFGLTFDTHAIQKGLDLSKFNKVILTVSYRGSAKLVRIDLRDHDPRYAHLARVANKANQADFPIREGQQTVSLSLDDFKVTDWWRNQTKATAELARPSFRDVVGMELVTGLDSGPGKQQFQIERVEFQRTLVSNGAWFGGLGAAWTLLIAFAVRHRRRHIARCRIRRTGDSRIVHGRPYDRLQYDHRRRSPRRNDCSG